ncbi:MAG: type II toxin-antitoxin system Phd/YefM family antitoxin [Chloroflexi bacterium]|nr:type II toxin-antitoxin system Phd/YefM family antitoxin [Chloroflexota bacterium]
MNTTTVSITQAKNNLADVVNRAAYGKERFLLLFRGKPKAAVVSVEDLRLLESLREDREARKAEQAAWLAQADALRQRVRRSGRRPPSRLYGIAEGIARGARG